MAPFGEAGVFIRGRREIVKIVAVGPDEDTPLEIREALVGMCVDVIFTKEMIINQCGLKYNDLPEGCRIAYAEEVIRLLEDNKKYEASEILKRLAPSKFDLYVFEDGIYEIVG